ncbi:hypothetical protein C3B79_0603 [Aeromonas hydrophila]|nr:hypothetical protein C3B79_0603 [Aeromonas hydrophila]
MRQSGSHLVLIASFVPQKTREAKASLFTATRLERRGRY